MGTVFAMTNTEAAVRMLWEIYPQTKATGKDEATAVRDDIITLQARAKNWRLEPVGATRWGESVERNYQDYMDFLLAQGVIKQKIDAKDIVTNELLDEINKFDANAIIAQGKG
jgi:NitT/TauT family transport system substrate-binding protein